MAQERRTATDAHGMSDAHGKSEGKSNTYNPISEGKEPLPTASARKSSGPGAGWMTKLAMAASIFTIVGGVASAVSVYEANQIADKGIEAARISGERQAKDAEAARRRQLLNEGYDRYTKALLAFERATPAGAVISEESKRAFRELDVAASQLSALERAAVGQDGGRKDVAILLAENYIAVREGKERPHANRCDTLGTCKQWLCVLSKDASERWSAETTGAEYRVSSYPECDRVRIEFGG